MEEEGGGGMEAQTDTEIVPFNFKCMTWCICIMYIASIDSYTYILNTFKQYFKIR